MRHLWALVVVVVVGCVDGADVDSAHLGADVRGQLAALAERARALGPGVAEGSEEQMRLAAAAAGHLRAAAAAVRATEQAVRAVVVRTPPTDSIGDAALVVQLQGLDTLAQLLERAARQYDRLVRAAGVAQRAGARATPIADRIDEALRSGRELDPALLLRLRDALARYVAVLEARAAILPRLIDGTRVAADRAARLAAEVTRVYAPLTRRALLVAEQVGSPRALAAAGAALARSLESAAARITREAHDLFEVGKTLTEQTDLHFFELTDIFDLLDDLVPDVDPTTSSLRILTYNVAFLSATVDSPAPAPDLIIEPNDGMFSGLDYEQRAKKIARGILQGDQDVVALNESFSDDAREVLVDELKGRYPNYVAKLGGEPVDSLPTLVQWLSPLGPSATQAILDAFGSIPGVTEFLVAPGDSGLMIFSKYPFLPLAPGAPNDALCSSSPCVMEGANTANVLDALLDDEVAFTVYADCTDFDCYVSKGVGVVKIDAPSGPTFVAFTHLQADYDDWEEHASIRFEQYQDIRDTLLASAADGELDDRRVIVLGDMNTPGHDRADPQAPSEWAKLTMPTTGGDPFFACGNSGPCEHAEDGKLLTDAWGFETSVDDDGLSQLNDELRLDYVFHNAPDGRTCMQHIMIAHDVSDDGAWYSDHLPVRADFNTSNQWCSANDQAGSNGPRDVTFPSSACDDDPNTAAPACDQDVDITGNLVSGGNFQWYRITQAGSYSIDLAQIGNGRVDFDVYQAADLSRPIAPFNEEVSREGIPYALLDPPYFIRVFAVDQEGNPNRTAQNRDYVIGFHQHLCRKATDACFLPSGAIEYPYSWPEITPISVVERLYFKFKTSGVKQGHLDPNPSHYPLVRFQQELTSFSPCVDEPALELYDDSYQLVQTYAFTGSEVAPLDSDWDDDSWKDERFIAPDLDGKALDLFETYMLVMQRTDSSYCEQTFSTSIRFETNLTYFLPGRVHCYSQYDDSGIGEDDHMRFRFFFDETYLSDPFYCDLHACPEQAFDEPDGDGWLNQFPELQGYFVTEVVPDFMEDDNGADFILSRASSVGTLFEWSTRSEPHFWHYDDPDPEDGDYMYRMEYVLCREKDSCFLDVN